MNKLVSTTKPSEVQGVGLHPLALLAVADHITTHSLQGQPGPIVGGLLGQHTGREVNVVGAFECKVTFNEDGKIVMDMTWFLERVQQCEWGIHCEDSSISTKLYRLEVKDAHKASPIEFVGWFSVSSESGPLAEHLEFHRFMTREINESAILLTFHPVAVVDEHKTSGKLPLAIYESFEETATRPDDGSEQVDEDGRVLRFRPIPYVVSADDVEMITLQHAIRHAGSAMAPKAASAGTGAADGEGSGSAAAEGGTAGSKSQEVAATDTTVADAGIEYTPEELERTYRATLHTLWPCDLANRRIVLTAIKEKSQAVKMLIARNNLLQAYQSKMAETWLGDGRAADGSIIPLNRPVPSAVDHGVLRQIAHTVQNFHRVTVANQTNRERAFTDQDVDRAEAKVMSALAGGLKEMDELSRHFNVSGVLSRENRTETSLSLSSPSSLTTVPPPVNALRPENG